MDSADEFLAAYDRTRELVWTFLGNRSPEFWLRRMLHDTTVHRYDACLTTGAAYALTDHLAEDGVNERMELLSDPVAWKVLPALEKLRGEGETLQFQPESGIGWFVTRTPSGIAYERKHGSADATVVAPMPALHLLLAGRIPVDQAIVAGNRTLIEHWLSTTSL